MKRKAWQPRDWGKNPPTLAEVKAYRRECQEAVKWPLFVNLSAEGAAETGAMIEAERRYKAMGLLYLTDKPNRAACYTTAV
jgi:hypothetical protein